MKLDKYDGNIVNSMKITQVVRRRKEQQWLKENKEAIDGHNERIKKYGCFSDEYRRF